MAVVCGCTWYLMRPEYGSVDCMLAECVMLLGSGSSVLSKSDHRKESGRSYKIKGIPSARS